MRSLKYFKNKNPVTGVDIPTIYLVCFTVKHKFLIVMKERIIEGLRLDTVACLNSSLYDIFDTITYTLFLGERDDAAAHVLYHVLRQPKRLVRE